MGEVAAAKVAGTAADLVGDGAHVGRGVERVEDEAGGLGRGVVERGADERAGGAEGFEEGVDNCGGATYDVAQAAEGAVEHEDVAGSHAELAQGVGDATAGEDHV